MPLAGNYFQILIFIAYVTAKCLLAFKASGLPMPFRKPFR
jgi:hypothetical protein